MDIKLLQTYGFGLVSTLTLKSIIWPYSVFVQSIGLLKLLLKVQGYRQINLEQFSIAIQVQICNFQTGMQW